MRYFTLYTVMTCLLMPLGALASSGPPATDIYVSKLKLRKDRISVGKAHNVTKRDGYDNQPAFMPDGKSIVYTSLRDGQADVYQYNLRRKTLRQVTNTPESEFSPTPIQNGAAISVIRVEMDQAQRLWQIDIQDATATLLLPKVKPVGYHSWMSPTDLALFVLGEPHNLQLVQRGNAKPNIVARNIGRSLHKIPERNALSFIQKGSQQGDAWTIKQLDLSTAKSTTLINTLPNSEDCTWTAHGDLLMAQGSKLYKWNAQYDTDWVLVKDFAEHGVKNITRLAVNPRGTLLAFVADR